MAKQNSAKIEVLLIKANLCLKEVPIGPICELL